MFSHQAKRLSLSGQECGPAWQPSHWPVTWSWWRQNRKEEINLMKIYGWMILQVWNIYEYIYIHCSQIYVVNIFSSSFISADFTSINIVYMSFSFLYFLQTKQQIVIWIFFFNKPVRKGYFFLLIMADFFVRVLNIVCFFMYFLGNGLMTRPPGWGGRVYRKKGRERGGRRGVSPTHWVEVTDLFFADDLFLFYINSFLYFPDEWCTTEAMLTLPGVQGWGYTRPFLSSILNNFDFWL